MPPANLPCESRHGRSGPRIFVAASCATFLLCCVLVLGRADDVALPQAFSKGRYEELRKSSPFALASATPPPTAPQASFAANWFVSGIARIGDRDFVTIKSRDLSKQFSLYGNHEAVDGVELASVTWSDSVGKSTVILRRGTETAKLEFNEAELHATPAPVAKGPQPNATAGARPGTPSGNSPLPNGNGANGANAAIDALMHPQPKPNAGGAAPVHQRVQVILPPQ